MAPTLSSLKYLQYLLEKNKDKQVVKNKKKFLRCMKVSTTQTSVSMWGFRTNDCM